ncbi:hypothetical protein T12_5044 [Trichinella patagoniensis]|uniref:Uncharacterized protein n=1 Tax=Trichinella patagoniensis TaxID=990121 RepID=A0A0V0ZAL8_9BILA|nr:hypothetical protein T12_5044 [Trichinella patagoniensis]
MKNVEAQFSSILNVLQLGSSNQQARVMKKKTARLASMPVGHALHVQHLHETRKQFCYCSLHQISQCGAFAMQNRCQQEQVFQKRICTKDVRV